MFSENGMIGTSKKTVVVLLVPILRLLLRCIYRVDAGARAMLVRRLYEQHRASVLVGWLYRHHRSILVR